MDEVEYGLRIERVQNQSSGLVRIIIAWPMK